MRMARPAHPGQFIRMEVSRIDDATVRESGAAAVCRDGAHTTAASPRPPVGDLAPRCGERVRELGTLGTPSPNGSPRGVQDGRPVALEKGKLTHRPVPGNSIPSLRMSMYRA